MTEQLHALLDSFRKPINNDRFDYSYERNYNDVIDDIQRRLAKVAPVGPVTAGDAGGVTASVSKAIAPLFPAIVNPHLPADTIKKCIGLIAECATSAISTQSQQTEYVAFKAGDTHCDDCPCRYGRHGIGPHVRLAAIDDLLQAMRVLFGNAYQPSRIQAETLVNTVYETLGMPLPTAPKQER